MNESSTTARILTTSQDNRDVALALVNHSKRNLVIFSRDLETTIYDTSEFIAAVRKLATASRYSKVRIVIIDPAPAIRNGHRLIQLGQRLSSFMEFRRPSAEHALLPSAFLVADETGFLYRPIATHYEGTADTDSPPEARTYLHLFEDIWALAEPDPEFRRLGL